MMSIMSEWCGVSVLLGQVLIMFSTSINGCEISRTLPTTKAPVIPLSPEDRVQAAVRDAMEQMHDGVVTLPHINKPNSHPLSGVVRAELGTTVNFTCDLPTGHPNSITEHLLWHHQNQVLDTRVTAPVTNKPFFYSHGKTHQTSYLFMHNITVDAAGTVECFAHNGTNTGIRQQQYHLIPKLRAKDVFVGQMPNVSTRYWQFMFTCKTVIDCSSGADPFFAWRYDGAFVKVPANHYLREIYRYYPRGVNGLEFASRHSKENGTLCEMTMSVSIYETFKFRPTTAECWVRIHPESDEWGVQTATVEFE